MFRQVRRGGGACDGSAPRKGKGAGGGTPGTGNSNRAGPQLRACAGHAACT
jgi:hypothetical protein